MHIHRRSRNLRPLAGCALAITTAAHAGGLPSLTPIAPLPGVAGTGVHGSIYTSLVTDSNQAEGTVASQSPAGSLIGQSFNYGPGHIQTPLSTWLGSDAASLTGLPGTTPAGSLVYAFNGFLAVPDSGIFTFAITSGSGMVFRLGDNFVAHADFDRPPTTSYNSATFTSPGLHRFSLIYWTNNFSDAGLRLEWARQFGTFSPIPASAFYAVPTPAATLVLGAGGLLVARRRR